MIATMRTKKEKVENKNKKGKMTKNKNKKKKEEEQDEHLKNPHEIRHYRGNIPGREVFWSKDTLMQAV